MSRENLSSGFSTSSDKNWAVQPDKMDKGLKFLIQEEEGLYCTVCVVKTKVLISCVVTVQLICAFVLTYAKKLVFS